MQYMALSRVGRVYNSIYVKINYVVVVGQTKPLKSTQYSVCSDQKYLMKTGRQCANIKMCKRQG